MPAADPAQQARDRAVGMAEAAYASGERLSLRVYADIVAAFRQERLALVATEQRLQAAEEALENVRTFGDRAAVQIADAYFAAAQPGGDTEGEA